MDPHRLVVDLLRHMEWADALVWKVVLAHESLGEDEALRGRLHHIHLVQRAFLDVWCGRPLDLAGGETFGPAALAAWARAYPVEAQRELAGLEASSLDRPVDLPWAARVAAGLGGRYVAPRLGETGLQVAMHSAHHRGQVTARIRELGVEPPLVDYIVWIWSGRPEPDWPAESAVVAR